MNKPRTQYTKSGLINIAYQVIGSGDIDIVYIPGWVSNIDLMWDNPELTSFLTKLSKLGRVILFDKRGTGLSDRISELSSLEERMDDIRAVLDAVDANKAVLFGHSEGGSVSALFAATYPERVIAMITFGVFAKRRYAENYPWAPTDEERQEVYDMIEAHWGSGQMDLASLAPSKKADTVFMEWLASYFRSGASPSAALVLTKMNTQVDIIDILPTIKVPTLLMYRTDDIDVKVGEGKFINEKIPHSKFIEFPGNDHLFWVGDAAAVLREMNSFIQNLPSEQQLPSDQKLATVLNINIADNANIFADLSPSEQQALMEKYLQIVENTSQQFRGKIISTTIAGTFAKFDGAIRAINCAMSIRQKIQGLKLSCKMGLHTGECYLSPQVQFSGESIDLAYAIQNTANRNQILISETVRNLIHGGGLDFTPQSAVAFNDRKISIFGANEHEYEMVQLTDENESQSSFGHSILDHVLESIDANIGNENFGIEILCAEVGMSERNLQRKIKAITNKSPNQMIRSYRLHKAKEKLTDHKSSISEVAYQTGFKSVSYFTKCFKKEFGLVPTEILQLSQ